MRLWENPNGVPCADVSWLKEDTERGLFTPVQMFKDSTGQLKRRRVMKGDRMWFYPPEPPGYVKDALPTPHLFFRSRVFVWRPVGVWRCSLKCPRGGDCGFRTECAPLQVWLPPPGTTHFLCVNTIEAKKIRCCYMDIFIIMICALGTPHL